MARNKVNVKTMPLGDAGSRTQILNVLDAPIMPLYLYLYGSKILNETQGFGRA